MSVFYFNIYFLWCHSLCLTDTSVICLQKLMANNVAGDIVFSYEIIVQSNQYSFHTFVFLQWPHIQCSYH